MDDFERELTQLMRDTQQHTPFEPRQRERLHAGIRARRRSRLLWKAGGSAVAVAGLGIGLALLPSMITRAQPADHRPRPATSPTPSSVTAPTSPTRDTSPSATASLSPPPATTRGDATPRGTRTTSAPPAATSSEGHTPSATTTPPASSAPPSALETQEPSVSATTE